MSFDAIKWQGDTLVILDQRQLPSDEVWIAAEGWRDVANAITSMAVRGAPLIGVAAAYGLALAESAGDMPAAYQGLLATRPTAVNLRWALDRVSGAKGNALQEALRIESEERANNDAIARHGASLMPHGACVLTICNTGSLATPGAGTALGIIREAYRLGKVSNVFSCESRPRMQGLRLTAWELTRDGIPFRSIVDGAAGALMAKGEVQFIVTGADRIAANGDTANKIGTYSLAVLAKHHGIPFVIAAPRSTVDFGTDSGLDIQIEERDGTEITVAEGVAIAPEGTEVWNPAFDVTPAQLISHIVTEAGVHSPPFAESLATATPVRSA
ncbi:MAG: S-methyl-5-thioribose-1-phosphate isomerase [Fimbriimonadales bacterium]